MFSTDTSKPHPLPKRLPAPKRPPASKARSKTALKSQSKSSAGSDTNSKSESRLNSKSNSSRIPNREHDAQRSSLADDPGPGSEDRYRHIVTEESRSSRSRTTFACPFYKYSPAEHRACARLNLTRISYVKQHLLRRHLAPPYCRRCLETFPDFCDFEAHIQHNVPCEERTGRINGITMAEKDQLSRRSDTSLNVREKWYEVWDILFPSDQSRPMSPYVDLDLPEEVNSLSEYLKSNFSNRLRGKNIVLSKEGAEHTVNDTLEQTVQEWKNIWQQKSTSNS